MASASPFLRTVPDGFHAALETLVKIPSGIIEEMCAKTLKYLQRRGFGCQQAEIQKELNLQGIQTTEEEVKCAINALLYIFREAAKYSEDLTTENGSLFAQVLARRTQLDTDTIKLLARMWREEESEVVRHTKHELFDIGRLVEFDWKLSVAVASHCCKNLNTPMVVVSLGVQNLDGIIKRHPIEMTIQEFKEFSKQFHDMASLMETL